MYDQSFNRRTLEHMLQKGDFHGIPASGREVFKENLLADAEVAALTNFGGPAFGIDGIEFFRSITGVSIFIFFISPYFF